MDNKAQVSLEYMVIITVLMAIAAVVAVTVTNLFTTKQSIGNTSDLFKDRALKMMEP